MASYASQSMGGLPLDSGASEPHRRKSPVKKNKSRVQTKVEPNQPLVRINIKVPAMESGAI
jgi:hypothetical protein